MQIAVVGSGLSALAAARALIRRGLKPIVIDAGEQVGVRVQSAVCRMAAQKPGDWSREDLALISRNPTLAEGGIPRKLVFGSDYIYSRDHPEAGVSGSGLLASTTLAKGGFANAWGGALLGATDVDLGDAWPVRLGELDRHFRSVMSWMPLSAGHGDSLGRAFPTYCSDAAPPLRLPAQGEQLLSELDALEEPRLYYGQARLAVHTRGERVCRYCAQCMSGCVYGSIFSAALDFEALEKGGRLEYRSGILVKTLREAGQKVVVGVSDLGGGNERDLTFDRVFLAAGAIGSTRIMLRSFGAFETPVVLADSQKFVVPMLRLKWAKPPLQDSHTLASLFLELRLPELADNYMHIQVMPANDFVVRRLGADRGPIIGALMSPLLGRIAIAWCSLHSDHSAGLRVRLKRTDNAGGTKLEADYVDMDRAAKSMKIAGCALFRLAPRFRSLALPMLGEKSKPGAGNHTGGSFPMSSNDEKEFRSDLFGRPRGYERVHIVDAAVMPNIPATTISLLMMANADRIASKAPII